MIKLHKNNNFNQNNKIDNLKNNKIDNLKNQANLEFANSNFFKPLSLDQNFATDQGFTNQVFEEKAIDSRDDI